MHTSSATTDGATPMTNRTRDTRTALQAYMAHHVEITEILERLLGHYRNHDDADATTLNWGDVGSIAHAHAQLRELSHWAFSEGEHAEVACLRCPATFGTSAELDAHYRATH